MEQISLGGRSCRGFAPTGVGENVSVNKATPALAAAMVGSTVGLVAHMLKAKTGYAILLGAGATILAHFGIEKASA